MGKSRCYAKLRQRLPALKAAHTACQLDPDNARNWVARMNAEREAGNEAQALESARRAVELDAAVLQSILGLHEVLQRSAK